MRKEREAHPYSGHCSISTSDICNCPCGGRLHGRDVRKTKRRVVPIAIEDREIKALLAKADRAIARLTYA